jgi:hypothetical protein
VLNFFESSNAAAPPPAVTNTLNVTSYLTQTSTTLDNLSIFVTAQLSNAGATNTITRRVGRATFLP